MPEWTSTPEAARWLVCCHWTDASARGLAERIQAAVGFAVPVVVCDSFGRAWREGIVNVALGVAGMDPFTDYRGTRDPYGYDLRVSRMASADALAAAAELAMGKVDGVPAVLVRGFPWRPGEAGGVAPAPPERLLNPALRAQCRVHSSQHRAVRSPRTSGTMRQADAAPYISDYPP